MRRLVHALAIVSVLILPFLVPVRNAAGIQDDPTLYEVTHLGSLGGTSSAGNSINDRSWVAGTRTCRATTTHATLWRDGATIDLGTLGGPNSGVLWPVKSENGMIVGVAETAELDPWVSRSCSAFFPSVTGHTCLGFVWEDGQMSPLPTLGGNNGFATGANNRGEVVGWAENTVHDPTCNPPQVLQFRATVWDTRRDGLRELPPLLGDTVTAATAVNDQEPSSASPASATTPSAASAPPTPCSGTAGRSPTSAILAARRTPRWPSTMEGRSWVRERRGRWRINAHAFLWTEAEGMQDLGTLPGDTISQGLGINGRGQVVGLSCGGNAAARSSGRAA